jgi:hypothetical protein
MTEMRVRNFSFVSGLALSTVVLGSILVTPATAKKKPPPPPPPPPAPASFSTYVKDVASFIDGAKCGLTPEAVVATSDGGSVALALSDAPNASASDSCRGVNWLVKLDASGNAQWQEGVGCFSLPPGSYSFGVSLQQTTDGGYVIGGSTIGCGSDTICPFLSGIQCGLVEKLDATGKVVWARVYDTGVAATAINNIRQTSDGGFVAAGSTYDSSQNTGALSALVLKLDGQGNVQWQRRLGRPGGLTSAYLNAVRQAPDGAYVAAGEFSAPSSCQYGHGCGQGVLAVKLDENGNVAWQRGFNSFDASGSPTASEHALSITASSDGGSVVAGNWGNTTGPGSCCIGASLLKLDANGNSEWQKAYSGGVHCYASFNTTCRAIGPLAYSVQQTSDGGYAMAGLTDLKEPDGAPQVPWLAKTDASGNLLWQHAYYQTYPTTGRTLSQYFASSDVTSSSGYLALGFTENSTDFVGELLAVKTDSAGLVGSCSQVHPATPLDTLDPGLATIAPALPVDTSVAARADAPSTTRPTSVSSTAGQC